MVASPVLGARISTQHGITPQSKNEFADPEIRLPMYATIMVGDFAIINMETAYKRPAQHIFFVQVYQKVVLQMEG